MVPLGHIPCGAVMGGQSVHVTSLMRPVFLMLHRLCECDCTVCTSNALFRCSMYTGNHVSAVTSNQISEHILGFLHLASGDFVRHFTRSATCELAVVLPSCALSSSCYTFFAVSLPCSALSFFSHRCALSTMPPVLAPAIAVRELLLTADAIRIYKEELEIVVQHYVRCRPVVAASVLDAHDIEMEEQWLSTMQDALTTLAACAERDAVAFASLQLSGML
jgi:hypothetical protein